MSELRAHRPEPLRQERDDTYRPEPRPNMGLWPHQLSHQPLLRVSDVLRLIQPEFPTLTTSKLRFLDSHGLVCPDRTGSGYRQYSPADVERLRFVLRQQRDHYRPLTVIAEHLTALDEGRMQESVAPHAVDGAEAAYLNAHELAARAGTDVEMIQALDTAGLISQTAPDRYERAALPLVVAACAYLRAGGDVRALRTLRNAARREVDIATNASAPFRAKGATGQADATAQDLGEAAVSVFSAYVRAGVNR